MINYFFIYKIYYAVFQKKIAISGYLSNVFTTLFFSLFSSIILCLSNPAIIINATIFVPINSSISSVFDFFSMLSKISLLLSFLNLLLNKSKFCRL
nr:MAG TPA: hypothetical protein [Caudoviricetes sp.]